MNDSPMGGAEGTNSFVVKLLLLSILWCFYYFWCAIKVRFSLFSIFQFHFSIPQ